MGKPGYVEVFNMSAVVNMPHAKLALLSSFYRSKPPNRRLLQKQRRTRKKC
jgi:hypothetical protein